LNIPFRKLALLDITFYSISMENCWQRYYVTQHYYTFFTANITFKKKKNWNAHTAYALHVYDVLWISSSRLSFVRSVLFPCPIWIKYIWQQNIRFIDCFMFWKWFKLSLTRVTLWYGISGYWPRLVHKGIQSHEGFSWAFWFSTRYLFPAFSYHVCS